MRVNITYMLVGPLLAFGCARTPDVVPIPEASTPVVAQSRAESVGTQVGLLVLRGEKPGMRYPLFEGANYLGRADQKPVDIDFDDQEPPDRTWTSRQHALVTVNKGQQSIEDMNSANGTFVNRHRVFPGKKQALVLGDTPFKSAPS
jgi:hypothetical protein